LKIEKKPTANYGATEVFTTKEFGDQQSPRSCTKAFSMRNTDNIRNDVGL
jgi:hypothetical protein